MSVIDLTETESPPSASRTMMAPPVFPAEPIGVDLSVDVLDLTEGREDVSIAQNFDWNDIAEQRAASAAFSMTMMASPSAAASATSTNRTNRTKTPPKRKTKKNESSINKSRKRKPPSQQQSPGERTSSKRKNKKPKHHGEDHERAIHHQQRMDNRQEKDRTGSQSHRVHLQPPRDANEFGTTRAHGNSHRHWPPPRHGNRWRQEVNMRPPPHIPRYDSRWHNQNQHGSYMHPNTRPPNLREHNNGSQNRGRQRTRRRHGVNDTATNGLPPPMSENVGVARTGAQSDTQQQQLCTNTNSTTDASSPDAAHHRNKKRGRRKGRSGPPMSRNDNDKQASTEERSGTSQQNSSHGTRSPDGTRRKNKRGRRKAKSNGQRPSQQNNGQAQGISNGAQKGTPQRGMGVKGNAETRCQDGTHRKKRRDGRRNRQRNKKARTEQDRAESQHDGDKAARPKNDSTGNHTSGGGTMKDPPASKNADDDVLAKVGPSSNEKVECPPRNESAAASSDTHNDSQVKEDTVVESKPNPDSRRTEGGVVTEITVESSKPDSCTGAAAQASMDETGKVDESNLSRLQDPESMSVKEDSKVHVSLPEMRKYWDETGNTRDTVTADDAKSKGTEPLRSKHHTTRSVSADGKASAQRSTSPHVVNVDEDVPNVASKKRNANLAKDSPHVGESPNVQQPRPQAESESDRAPYTKTDTSAEVINVDEDARSGVQEGEAIHSTKRFVQPLSTSETDPVSSRASSETPSQRSVSATSKDTVSSGWTPSLKDLIGSNSGARSGVAKAKLKQNPTEKAETAKPPPAERKSWQSTVIIVDSSDEEEMESQDATASSEKRKDPEVEFVKTSAAPHWPPKRRRNKPGRPPSSTKQYKKKALGIERNLRNVGQYNFNYSEEEAYREQERLFREAADRLRREAAATTSGNQVASDVRDLRHDHWKTHDPYLRLGLSRNAPIRDVKRRYRRLALVYHPDKGSTYVHTTARFQAVTEAYKLLCEDSERLN